MSKNCSVIVRNKKFNNREKAIKFLEQNPSSVWKEEELGQRIDYAKAYDLARQLLPGFNKKDLSFVTSLVMEEITKESGVLGRYQKGAIFLLENSDKTIQEKVLKHEIFHKIYNEYLTEKERIKIYNAFSSKLGVFDPIDLEEKLAETFQERDVKKSNILKVIFNKILRFLNLLTVNTSSIDELMNQISSQSFTIRKTNSSIELPSRNITHIKRVFGSIENFNQLYSNFINYHDTYAREGKEEVIDLYFIHNNLLDKIKSKDKTKTLRELGYNQGYVNTSILKSIISEEAFNEIEKFNSIIKQKMDQANKKFEYKDRKIVKYNVTNKGEIKSLIFREQKTIIKNIIDNLEIIQQEKSDLQEKLKNENLKDSERELIEFKIEKLNSEITTLKNSKTLSNLFINNYDYINSLIFPRRDGKRTIIDMSTLESFEILDTQIIEDQHNNPELEEDIKGDKGWGIDSETHDSKASVSESVKAMLSNIIDETTSKKEVYTDEEGNKNTRYTKKNYIKFGTAYQHALKLLVGVNFNAPNFFDKVHKRNKSQIFGNSTYKSVYEKIKDIYDKATNDTLFYNGKQIVLPSNIKFINLDEKNESIILSLNNDNLLDLRDAHSYRSFKQSNPTSFIIKIDKPENSSTIDFLMYASSEIAKYQKLNGITEDNPAFIINDVLVLNELKNRDFHVNMWAELSQNFGSQQPTDRVMGSTSKGKSRNDTYRTGKKRDFQASIKTTMALAIANKFNTIEDYYNFLNNIAERSNVTFKEALLATYKVDAQFARENLIKDFLDYIGLDHLI